MSAAPLGQPRADGPPASGQDGHHMYTAQPARRGALRFPCGACGRGEGWRRSVCVLPPGPSRASSWLLVWLLLLAWLLVLVPILRRALGCFFQRHPRPCLPIGPIRLPACARTGNAGMPRWRCMSDAPPCRRGPGFPPGSPGTRMVRAAGLVVGGWALQRRVPSCCGARVLSADAALVHGRTRGQRRCVSSRCDTHPAAQSCLRSRGALRRSLQCARRMASGGR